MKGKLAKPFLSLCSLLLIFGLAACGGTSQSASTNNGDAVTKSVSAEERKLDEEVFPKDTVVDVKITIDEDDFQDMLDNASAEEYKKASVDYNGQHFDNIGIRTKGNLSLRSVVQMPDSDRYSFKLSFDEYLDQTLNGISKINLNNNYSDATSMREFLTYELAEEMGLPTPKYSFVNVYVNDELWGFYLAVEQIGDAYLNRHFGNAYGALYKGQMTGSGSDLAWLGDDPDSYTGLALKSKTTNGDVLIDMLDELNNGSDYEKVLDVEESLGYIALNVLTNNTDSYIGGNKQNYYLYEDDGVFSVLPWDYNMAFGGLGGGGMGGGFGGAGRAKAGADTGGNAPADGAGAAGDAAVGGAGASPAGGEQAAGPTGAAAGRTAGGAATGGQEAPAQADTAGGDQAAGAGAGQGEAGAGKTGGGAAAGPGGGGGSSLLIDEPTQGAVAERPLVAKLLAVDEYKELYHSILQEAVDGYLDNDTFTARVNEVSAMISSYVKADPRPFYTYEQFEEAVPKLISTNASQVENISQQLDGTLPSSGDGSGSGGGMGGMRSMGGRGGGDRPAFGAAGPQTGQATNDAAAPNNAGQAGAVDGQSQQISGAAQQGAAGDGAGAAGLPGGAPPDVNGGMPQLPPDGQMPQMPPDGMADGQMPGAQSQQPADDAADADNGAGIPGQQGANGGQWGPGGDFGGGFGGDQMGREGWPDGFGGFGQGDARKVQTNPNEALTAGISLLILLLACVFVVFFRRKRL
ncbi:CotH kinase family protein [Paenibacillus vini]|uniref:CotH kinase family protein n=1 Tax=Paenibacillus vini TaxID=1476024 RepID=UPI0025B6CEA5|nr:CotH kinase family protein [Paenibacillus vini]MDN4071164.1 CotH kinase family protein [Paenibacillus vini]